MHFTECKLYPDKKEKKKEIYLLLLLLTQYLLKTYSEPGQVPGAGYRGGLSCPLGTYVLVKKADHRT